ncbi:hypothetical protein OKA04_18260 [Luteolibacter flavescens]|uniref:Uncharacterized protein n=1 Tax=Luteolibacter flavescens TaxID=1859460 RepID=A0ABT3FSX8_9BACT|nr:hypothetical protein [Luteolibacter flavescens]MCW1886688.1 hypothetical protein [Luteolibacter flavescens]
MAIKLIANYSKRLGLPGYSSHQFSIEIETELVTTDDVAAESARIYELLQTNVDEQIRQTGFVPPTDYGMEETPASPANIGRTNGSQRPAASAAWKCTDKQRELIENLVTEHQLDKNEVDHLARQRFGKGVRELNKVEASGLLNELLESHSGQQRPAPNGRRSAYAGINGNTGGKR